MPGAVQSCEGAISMQHCMVHAALPVPCCSADLSEVSSTQLLETLRGQLPSLRQHLDTSLDALNLGLSDAAMDEADQQ